MKVGGTYEVSELFLGFQCVSTDSCLVFPSGSPSRGGDIGVYVINQTSLPTPFYYVFVSVSVFMTLLTVFHSTKSNYPDNSLLSNSVLPVLFLP